MASGNKKQATIRKPRVVELDDDIASVAAPLIRYTAELAEAYKPTAPVKLPDTESLTVQLVNVTLLQRLDDARADVSLMQNILWCTVGGLFGQITTLVTSDHNPGSPAIALLVGLIGLV